MTTIATARPISYRTAQDLVSKPLPRDVEEAKERFIREKRQPGRAAKNAEILVRRLAREHPHPNARQVAMTQGAWRVMSKGASPAAPVRGYAIAELLNDTLIEHIDVLIDAGMNASTLQGDTLVLAFNQDAPAVFERLYGAGLRIRPRAMDDICDRTITNMRSDWLMVLARCDYGFKEHGYVPNLDRKAADEEARAALYTKALLHQVNHRARSKPTSSPRGL